MRNSALDDDVEEEDDLDDITTLMLSGPSPAASSLSKVNEQGALFRSAILILEDLRLTDGLDDDHGDDHDDHGDDHDDVGGCPDDRDNYNLMIM